MGALAEKLEELEQLITRRIIVLTNTEGVGQKSDVVSENVLKIENEELMYNIDGTSTYVVAVSPYALISETGYTYAHSGIELEQLCEIVDSFEEIK